MTTHLYCVLPASAGTAVRNGLAGIGGGLVRALPVANLVAWVSDVRPEPGLSYADIRTHNDVVETAMATGATPVPARYGQRFTDDEACCVALAARAESIEALLAAMQGYVEMTLLITPSTRRMIDDLQPVLPEMFDASSDGVGRRYLDTLRKRELRTGAINHAADDLATALEDVSRRFVRQSLTHQTATPMPLRTISHLVARADVAQYEAGVSAVHGIDGFRFLVIGPRPPYSFCALGADGGGTHGMNLAV